MGKIIPLHCLVLMVGPSCAGKSILCDKSFKPYEVLSIDAIREQLVGDPVRRDVTEIAWEHLYERAKLKLQLGERVVIDAPHLKKNERQLSAEIGQQLGVPIFYIIVDRPLQEKLNTAGWRDKFPNLIQTQDQLFQDNQQEIIWGDGLAEVIDSRTHSFQVIEKPSRTNLLEDLQQRGFNGISVIGDVHGQFESFSHTVDWARRRNHFMVFLGDLIDHGPKNIETIDLAYYHITRGNAVNVIGNHELKIQRWLTLRDKSNFRLVEANMATIGQIEKLTETELIRFKTKFSLLMNLGAYHWVLGKFVFAHGAANNQLFTIHDTQLRGKLGKFVMLGEIEPTMGNEIPKHLYGWIHTIPKSHVAIVGHDIRSIDMPLRVTNNVGGEVIFLDTGSGKGGYLTCADIPFNDMKVTNFFRY